jgi:hypothetical protein
VCEHMDLPAAAAATNGSPTSTGLALPPLSPTSIDDGKSGELSRLPGVWWQRPTSESQCCCRDTKREGGCHVTRSIGERKKLRAGFHKKALDGYLIPVPLRGSASRWWIFTSRVARSTKRVNRQLRTGPQVQHASSSLIHFRCVGARSVESRCFLPCFYHLAPCAHHSAPQPPGSRRLRILMLFSFLTASVGTGPPNTTSINITPIVAVDHEFLVTLKPAAANANGRRLDTTEKGSSTIGENLSTPTRAPCPENILTAWHLHAWAAGGTSSRLGWVVYPYVGL